jgi:hypothetical protein
MFWNWYFVGMTNSAAVSVLNLNINIVRNLSKSAVGTFTALSNTGAVLSSISINGNQLGNDSGGFTYSAANSATLLGISNTSGTANCNLSIQNNDIRGITHTVEEPMRIPILLTHLLPYHKTSVVILY